MFQSHWQHRIKYFSIVQKRYVLDKPNRFHTLLSLFLIQSLCLLMSDLNRSFCHRSKDYVSLIHDWTIFQVFFFIHQTFSFSFWGRSVMVLIMYFKTLFFLVHISAYKFYAGLTNCLFLEHLCFDRIFTRLWIVNVNRDWAFIHLFIFFKPT